MDELVIGDKKYISSKRAAEVTGYAKDYIGQLCREGRVEARLVGRSWYVLDSAIQEHRFGQVENVNNQVNTGYNDEVQVEVDSPVYTTEPVVPIPLIEEKQEEVEEQKTQIQEVWQDWYTQKQPEVATENFSERERAENQANEVQIQEYQEPVELSFNKIPSDEAVFSYEPQNDPPANVPIKAIPVRAVGGYYALRAILVLISVISIGIAVIGSGKIEATALKYIPGSIAGVSNYSASK